MSIWLFAGQGAQSVGMCSRLATIPAVAKLFERASTIIGRDLLKICVDGPKEDLDRTENCQPAIVAASLAALESAASEGKGIITPTCAAGFSLGEITALIAAESLSIDDGFRLVKVRAEAMQRASDLSPSGMLTVVGLTDDQLGDLCSMCPKEKGHLQIANYLFPRGRVMCGHNAGIEWLVDQLSTYKPKPRQVRRISVSGAFHSPLMKLAQNEVKSLLDTVDIKLPRFHVYSNVTARPYESEDQVRVLLARQVCEPVQWEQSMINIINYINREKIEQVYEIGPGKQLKAALSRIDSNLGKTCKNVEAQ